MTARLSNFPESSPGHEALAEWNALKNGLTRKAKNRNKLAHGTVLQFNWRDRRTGEPKTDILFAPYFFKGQAAHIPSLEEMRRADFDPRPKGRVYAKDIRQYEVGFKKAEDRLRRLKEKIRWLELP